jgi:hypothetical protein
LVLILYGRENVGTADVEVRMVGASQHDHRWPLALAGWPRESAAFIALKMTKDMDYLKTLTNSPSLEMVRAMEANQSPWQKALSASLAPFDQLSKIMRESLTPLGLLPRAMGEALSPFRDLSKVMAITECGPLAEFLKMQRDMRLTTDVLIGHTLGKSIAASIGDQIKLKMPDLGLGLGVGQWADSILQSQKQWTQLAAVAGLSGRIQESAFGPLIALQRSMALAGHQSADWVDQDEDTSEAATAMTAEELRSLVDQDLETKLAPVIAEIKGQRTNAPLALLFLLFQILSGLASLVGAWPVIHGGNEPAGGISVSPEKVQELQESIALVIALGQQLQGAERVILRDVQLRKSPKGRLLPWKVRPGQVVQVLGERHGWIAIGFEAGEDSASGWVMKKYTTNKASSKFARRKD